MKLDFNYFKSGLQGGETRRGFACPEGRGTPPQSPQSGIALVITLIMLSVTLVMAVSFIAISSRERGSVTTGTDANHARLAAEAGLAAAEGQILASGFSTTNFYNFTLLVSTNYINRYGFVGGIINPTNVNYSYQPDGAPLTAAEMVQNIANLEILPRAPVFVPNNSPSGYDFRYYLDLNRNGLFDDTGNVTNLVLVNKVLVQTNLATQIGDPQWIGVLEHPDAPHGPYNRFIGRYCFIAIPVGNTLDVNAIHNDSAGGAIVSNTIADHFERNQGVGTWELNLAAFLADLNTNQWDNSSAPYDYEAPYGLANQGSAFDDAFSLLSYRYGFSKNYQPGLQQFNHYNDLPYGYIDEFGSGPLMFSNNLPPLTRRGNIGTIAWPGSQTTNLFFTPSDFFNRAKTQAGVIPPAYGFTDRLLNAGTNTYGTGQVPTYDRYTFYRMLSQLGTDSTPEYGKMNLNFVNVDNNGNVVPGMETNFIRWNAGQFFTNAANRLLQAYTANWFTNNLVTVINGTNYVYNNYYFTNTFGATNTALLNPVYKGAFGISNIPVWVNGQFVYTPTVHRLLQLAANMYDATTNSRYPSVFRPIFTRDGVNGSGTNIFICGYQYIPYLTSSNITALSTPTNVLGLESLPLTAGGATMSLTNVNVYGVPWVIGAKKGLPAFNELYSLNNVDVIRKMQVNLPSVTGGSANTTNKQYIISITNIVGMSFWNSYYSNYYGTGNLRIYMQDTMAMALINTDRPAGSIYSPAGGTMYYNNIYSSYWPGSSWSNPQVVSSVNPASFATVTFTNVFLPPSAYYSANGGFLNINEYATPWETNINNNYRFPHFALLTTNWAQAFILDGPSGGTQYIVDYVQFGGPTVSQNLATELADPNSGGMWSTNANGGAGNADGYPSFGEVDQINDSMGLGNPVLASGETGLGGNAITQQQSEFQAFVMGRKSYVYNEITYPITETSLQAPYTPQRLMSYYTLWEANDPLVHYTAADLNFFSPGNTGLQIVNDGGAFPALPGLNLTQVGTRYQPWGLGSQMSGLSAYSVDVNSNNMAYKDPLATGSDAWQFPTNLYPDVGWLGRIHRGTPWQTVFLKSTNLMSMVNYREGASTKSVANGLSTWQAWTGNTSSNAFSFDANNSMPAYDRWLFDLFTAAPSDAATLGELSVNQPHLAAWSALLSGIPMYTNFGGTPSFAQPAGINGTNYIAGNPSTYLGYIWNNIQQTRTTTNLFPSQAFVHVGDICAVPALSDASPYLHGLNSSAVNDEMYEWIAQHTLSQLKVGSPRYVIYCYGQALKPAANGIMTGGAYPLMCTNYQIVAESAIRVVMQVENANSANPTVVIKNVNPLPPDQ